MIIIPMAGLSSRFFDAGYDRPKYMLEAFGKTLFEHSVNSFKTHFLNERFIFVIRDIYDSYNFVKSKCESLKIYDFDIIKMENETRGQAETVALALEKINEKQEKDEELTIFNIDTIRLNFKHPEIRNSCAGYLEVFRGDGEHWSFVQDANDGTNRVIRTTEKNRISDLCSTGLYYFKSRSMYLEAFYNYLSKPIECWEKGELYIAPLYNYLIKKDEIIKYDLIAKNDVIFCGTPDEYIEFINQHY